jgi:nitrous oxide reductase
MLRRVTEMNRRQFASSLALAGLAPAALSAGDATQPAAATVTEAPTT